MIGSNPPDEAAFLTQDIFEVIVSTFLQCNILTDRVDVEFHHSVFPNSIQQIALLGFPRVQSLEKESRD